MRIQHVRSNSIRGLGIAVAMVIAACEPAPDQDSVATEAPLDARIGNVATAELRPSSGSTVSGSVNFAQLDEALRIEATVSGLTPGEHGLHLHENGDCSAADASSAGGHWSPDDDPHGAPTDHPTEHHAGDLGNLTAGSGGMGNLVQEDAELTLIGEYGVVGRAVVVHRGADDLQSQPAGDAGEPVACGVVEWGTDSE